MSAVPDIVVEQDKQKSNPNLTGWVAQLDCQFEPGPERTIVRRKHKGPLYIQRAFYPEGPVAHVYMLHPPSGVVGGDVLDINMGSAEGAHALISTPGATKFYRSAGQWATVNQTLAARGGHLEWLPAENIFFSGSKTNVSTTLKLDANASIAFWEINCLGQHAANKPFTDGALNSTIQVYVENKLLLKERFIVNDQFPIGMRSGLRGNTVSATLILTPLQKTSVEFAQNLFSELPQFTATWFDSILVARYLGNSSEEAKAGFIRIWSGLRKGLNGAESTLPRIWAT